MQNENDCFHILLNHLKFYPTGADADENEILLQLIKSLFTSEEAQLALHLPHIPITYSTRRISKSSPFGFKKTNELLNKMGEKGLVYSVRNSRGIRYALLPITPGLFEFHYMRKFKNNENVMVSETSEKSLDELWLNYLNNCYRKELQKKKTPLTRVIPIEKNIKSNIKIFSYEEAMKVIKRAKVIALSACACRSLARNCNRLLETCMSFDRVARFVIEKGFGKEIDIEKAENVLIECERQELIHCATNTKYSVEIMCNCCSCCCIFFSGLAKLKVKGIISTSNFIAEIHYDKCKSCGFCYTKCKMNAIILKDEIFTVDVNLCIGCGLCGNFCPEGAIKLIRRKKYLPSIPHNPYLLFYRLSKEKGKVFSSLLTYLKEIFS